MALHDAALSGDIAKTMSALNAGFEVNDARATAYANLCSTGLHVAAEHGHADVVELLLASGANPLLADGWGHTAAHLAALEDNSEIVEILVAKDPRVLDMLDDQDRTPLHAAAHAGNEASVRILLAKGAKVQRLITEIEGDTIAIGSAVHTAAAAGHADCLQLLVAAATPDAINGVDCFDRSPLVLAAAAGHSDCLQVLIAAGAAVNATNSWGASSLHLAARAKSSAAVQVLLSHGAEANSVDNHTLTPVHYAAQAACLPAIAQLLDSGAAVDARTELGATPLQIVATGNVADAVALLLPAGAALASLQPCWHDLDAAVKAVVHAYVRGLCLSTAGSIRRVSMCAGGGVGLSTDVVHCILERVLGTDEKFVRLLLDGDSEGCV